MAKLRGKFGHQFRCILGVAPFLVTFNKFIGAPEGVGEWDENKEIQWVSSTDGFHDSSQKGQRCGRSTQQHNCSVEETA
jgi:hypothetical protein